MGKIWTKIGHKCDEFAGFFWQNCTKFEMPVWARIEPNLDEK
jgi:hypothetical protein